MRSSTLFLIPGICEVVRVTAGKEKDRNRLSSSSLVTTIAETNEMIIENLKSILKKEIKS